MREASSTEAADAITEQPIAIEPKSAPEKRPSSKVRIARAKGTDMVLMAIGICGILLVAGGIVFAHAYDNDVWFFLATGEYIVNNGIPYTNPFSIQPDMGFIAQQWLHCVISYALYSAGGFVAMGIWTTALFFALAISLFVLGCRLRGTHRGSQVVMILIAISVIGMTNYTSVRPHLYSMIAFTWVIWACESYRARGDWRYLILLPFIACLHVNIHAAMAPYDLFIIFCYALPDIPTLCHKKGKLFSISFVNASYRRAPLWIALGVSALALLINPYGIRGALYLFLSFGAASYRNRIKEMGSLTPGATYQNAMAVLLMFLATLTAGRMGLKRINLPLFIFAFVGIVGGLMYLRNNWLAALFCLIYIVWATRRLDVDLFGTRIFAKIAAVCIVLAGVVGMLAYMITSAPGLADEPKDCPSTPVYGVRYLDELGVDKGATNVFTFFNAGGYLEFSGFKVNMDPRPEIWNSAITGKDREYYFEYVDMAAGDVYFERYNARFDFDVYFIDSAAGTDPFFEQNPGFVELQGGNGYRVYAKESWIEQYL